jgi:nucleoside transporter
MNVGLRWRLTLMMFLEFAIWGAWSPVLSAYLGSDLHFTGGQIGWIYAMLPLATIFAPMVFGQLADRYIATEWLLGILSLIGAGLLWLMAGSTAYGSFLWIMLAYSAVYAPTLVLTNSLSFDHLQNSEKDFGGIRAGGTLGWMIAGYCLTAWLSAHMVNNALPQGSQVACLQIAAIFSLGLGLFSFALPHTPPRREGADPWAFLKALQMLTDRNFLIFMIISFIVATELMFYYQLTAPFLEGRMGVAPTNTSTVMTIAQGAELFVVGLLLPYALPRLGVRKIMVLGILAWPIRYAVFALGAYVGPSLLPLVEISLALHGFCYVFFFVVGFIYVDQVASPDIRASAQSLIGVVSMGIGLFLGSILAGQLKDAFTTPGVKGISPEVVHWTPIFLVPCALTVLCAIIFPLIFRDQDRPNRDNLRELQTEPLPVI